MADAPAGTRRRVRREQMSDEVAAHLRVEIITGNLRAGTFVRLDDTAARLGVSITPVREALRTLRGEGMVQLEPHRGHVVSALTRRDVEDIFWLQGVIARELAASAAARITDDQIDELVALNEELARTVSGDSGEAVAAAEFAFHRTLNRATGRIKLAWFLLHVARYLPPLLYAGDVGWGVDAVAHHHRLIDALRRHDVDAVVRIADEQFTDGARRLMERLDRVGMWPEPVEPLPSS